MITATINGQHLRLDQRCIVAGGIGCYEFRCAFSHDWDRLTKTVKLVQGDTVLEKAVYSSPGIGERTDSFDALTPGWWECRIYGEGEDKTITTVPEDILVQSFGAMSAEDD